MKAIRLGINIDHAATLRNARGENDPSILEIAFEAQNGGADSLTMHLREDRRHIRDEDIFLVKKHLKIPLNMEMAATEEMLKIALELKPKSVCLVPEKREEVTTEGGLDLQKHWQKMRDLASELLKNEIEVFLFVEPDPKAIELALKAEVSGVEIHTGAYARSFLNAVEKKRQMEKIVKAAEQCQNAGLEFHAGHGLNYHNIFEVMAIKNLLEVNIGHAILARALVSGIKNAVKDMKGILDGRA